MKRLLLLAAVSDVASAQPLSLHRLFSDHMVLQRDLPIPVYGEGKPDARVSIRIGSVTADATVTPEGRWKATLPAVPAGGPYEMEITMAGERIQLKNILTGDVWLASGQSNMAWKVGEGVLNKEQEIADANHEGVRFFNVPERLAAAPKAELTGGQWETCSPASIGGFSAAAYFFALEINRETGVPIGIIASARGGTPVEAWMSPTAFAGFPNDKKAWIESLDAKFGGWENAVEPNNQAIGQLVEKVGTSMHALEAGVLEPGFDDSAWRSTDFFDAPPKPNKIRWLRRKINLSADHAAMATTLSLARPNDLHTVYLNGKKVAVGRNKACVLELPPGSFRTGDNQLTVRLGSCWTPPAVGGIPDDVFLRSADDSLKLSLKDGWKCSDAMEPPLPEFLSLTDIPSCLFNGMIQPLLQSPVKGVIWYQGEQNLGNADAYAKLFPTMIRDWRAHFKQDAMPFYFVQLANLGAPSDLPANDAWPLLREAQARALTLPNTGMATAFDIGEALDIHPKNKQDVGRRLALQALAKTYGKSIGCHGPVYQKCEARDNSLIIHFDHADGLKTTDGSPPKGFAIAGGDRVFHRATAVIQGATVVLDSEKVPHPVAARYAFADNPVANLHNAANLPAYPFRSDDWNQITTSP
jgi:sialate O-acetylesterase